MDLGDKDKLLVGHEADGIQELDNDLPLWWFVGFVFTVVFAFGYLVNYHMSQGPSSKQEYEQEVAAFRTDEPKTEMPGTPVDPLTDFASLDKGRMIFEGTTNNCFTCHRADLGGQVGPNLTDEFWMHGGDMRSIMKSITTGYPAKGMLPFGTGARLTEEQLLQVASYVYSKQGSNPPNPKAIDPARETKWVDGKPVESADKPAEEKPQAKETAVAQKKK